MNYLAHFLLAGPDPAARVGQLLGDYHKGPAETLADPAWVGAVRLHRAIDRYTDAHPQVVASRARFHAPYRRYAGIVVDLAYDHVLARHWSRYAEEPLEAFVAAVHAALAEARPRLPAGLLGRVDHLTGTGLLLGYREFAGIERALAGLATRLSRPSPLATAGPALAAVLPALEADFHAFFPELVAFVAAARDGA